MTAALLGLLASIACAGQFQMMIRPSEKIDGSFQLVNSGNSALALKFARLLDLLDPKYKLSLDKMAYRPLYANMPASDHLIKRFTMGYSAASDYEYINSIAFAALARSRDKETRELAEEIVLITSPKLTTKGAQSAVRMAQELIKAIGDGTRPPEMIWPTVGLFKPEPMRDERFIYLRLPMDVPHDPIIKSEQLIDTYHMNGFVRESHLNTLELVAKHFTSHPVNQWPNQDWVAMSASGALLAYRITNVLQKYEMSVIKSIHMEMHPAVKKRLEALLGNAKIVKEP